MADRDGFIWYDGKLVPWREATTHVLTHSLHYGTGVFEGIRAYETERGPAVFRLTEHITRLFDSARIMMMEIPYTVDQLVQATKDTVRATGLASCYVRPIAFYGYGEMGLNTLPCEVDVSIACWPWGAYLGADAVSRGVRMKISSWTRHDHNTMPPLSKTTGNYVNSSLAKVEDHQQGSSSSHQPIGRSSRAMRAYGRHADGRTRSAQWPRTASGMMGSISIRDLVRSAHEARGPLPMGEEVPRQVRG